MQIRNKIIIKKEAYIKLLFYLTCYAVLICTRGVYLYGNDLIEILPYLKKLNDNSLYPSDFYLNQVWSKSIFERSIYIHLLHIIHADIFWLRILIHAFISILLIHALHRIIKLFIHEDLHTKIALICFLVLSNYTSFGGNELYYNALIPSLAAKTCILYGILAIYSNKYIMTAVLLSIATIIHAAVGLQIWLLFGLIILIKIINGTEPFKKIFIQFGIIAFLNLVYLVILLLQSHNIHHSSHELYLIQEFRTGHHLLAQYTSIFDIIIFVCLYFIGLFFYKKKSIFFYQFYLVQGIILVVYILLSTGFHQYFIFNLFWIKTTIYIEFFSFIAIISLIINAISLTTLPRFSYPFLPYLMSFVVSIFFLWKHNFNICFDSTAETEIANLARGNSSKNSLFLLPPNFSSFKTIAERSSFVDYKAILQDPNYLFPWYDRIQQFYGISYQDRTYKLDLNSKSLQYYNNLNWQENISVVKKLGINYIIVLRDSPSSQSLNNLSHLVCSTSTYQLFRISY